MTAWADFNAVAPHIAEIFVRRHAVAGNLCMLGTLRADGFPRISPMEPQFFGDELVLAGMPGTAKFGDLERDSRFTLHTATVDPQVGDGDAKVWGRVEDVLDPAVHERFAAELFARTGFDLRGQKFEHFYCARIVGAAAVEIVHGHLDVTVWREGAEQATIRKH